MNKGFTSNHFHISDLNPALLFKKSGGGFTLIELLVSMTVIGILSAVLFSGRMGGERELALQRAIYQLSQDLREVQEMAMGTGEFSCNGSFAHNFGIYFKEKDYYIIFADCDGNHNRGGGDEDIRTVLLEEGVEISDLAPASSFAVVFEAPDPKTYIKGKDWGEEAVITLEFDSTKSRKVKINSAGKIEIE